MAGEQGGGVVFMVAATGLSSSGGSGSTILIIILIALLLAAVGTFIALYFINDDFRELVNRLFGRVKDKLSVSFANQKVAHAERARQKAVRDITNFIDDATLHVIMANVSAALTFKGFILQAQQPGLYTYARTERPSILVAIILWCLCFIPGIIYLGAGGGVSTATVQISRVQQGYLFTASGPARAIVREQIRPYTIRPEMLM
jgi:uncharacterized membrane protein YqaE (UPF0057 family)